MPITITLASTFIGFAAGLTIGHATGLLHRVLADRRSLTMTRPKTKLTERERRIVRRAEVLAAGTLDPQLGDVGYHESGRDAYGRDVLLHECPYRAGPEQDDWLRGWRQAREAADPVETQ